MKLALPEHLTSTKLVVCSRHDDILGRCNTDILMPPFATGQHTELEEAQNTTAAEC